MPAQTAQTLYEILGVDQTATPGEIKNAYRTLAKSHHPDVGGTVSGFTKIQKAYELLSDPKRRKAYDALHDLLQKSKSNQSNQPSYQPGQGFNTFSSGSFNAFSSGSSFQWGGFTTTSAAQSAPTKRSFLIPRHAILAGRLSSSPAGFAVFGTVNEIEIELDTLALAGNYPMPGDLVVLEFNYYMMPTSTVDAEVIEAIYTANSAGGFDTKLRVRRANP